MTKPNSVPTKKPLITAEESQHLIALFEAWRSLKSMGWEEPRYFKFPPEGIEFELIELGSTGIHRAIGRGLDQGKRHGWITSGLRSRFWCETSLNNVEGSPNRGTENHEKEIND